VAVADTPVGLLSKLDRGHEDYTEAKSPRSFGRGSRNRGKGKRRSLEAGLLRLTVSRSTSSRRQRNSKLAGCLGRLSQLAHQRTM